MRWILGVTGFVAAVAIMAGCQPQKCFLSEKEFLHAHHLPLNLERDYQPAIVPQIPLSTIPANVDHPERMPWTLSLPEAFAIALENGSTNSRAGNFGFGQSDDSMLNFSTGSSFASLVGQTDRVRVLALNPAIASAGMEAALARFDALYVGSMNWSATDNITQGLNSFSNGTRAELNQTIAKTLATGGVANMSFSGVYQLLTNPPATVINPLYTTRLTFGFEQPLWRDFGTEINQLLNRPARGVGTTFPTSAFGPFNNKDVALNQAGSGLGFSSDGILIARLRFDASRAEFERQVHYLLANVECAYWKLYQAYGQLYAFEEVMRLAHRAWLNNQLQIQVGKISPTELGQIRGQYEEFRGERMKALGAVLDAERNLRGILGLPVEDGKRLVPCTGPSLAAFSPDWCASLTDALTHRPEMILARDNLRAAQFNLIAQQNFLKPDLRFVAQYSPVGFGTRLDGRGTLLEQNIIERPNNALRSLADDHFNDWSLGITAAIPLGFRQEHAAVRAAKLGLAQSYMLLKDQEQRAERNLAREFAKTTEWYRRIEAARAERKAYGEAVAARFKAYLSGRIPADALLESQRRLALAQVREYEAITEYNCTLAKLEHAKGTIMLHNNIVISEGGLPECAQVRAVENERQRSKALIMAERPDPMRHPGRLACAGDLPTHLEQTPMPVNGGENMQQLPALGAHGFGATQPQPGPVPVNAMPFEQHQGQGPAHEQSEPSFHKNASPWKLENQNSVPTPAKTVTDIEVKHDRLEPTRPGETPSQAGKPLPTGLKTLAPEVDQPRPPIEKRATDGASDVNIPPPPVRRGSKEPEVSSTLSIPAPPAAAPQTPVDARSPLPLESVAPPPPLPGTEPALTRPSSEAAFERSADLPSDVPALPPPPR